MDKLAKISQKMYPSVSLLLDAGTLSYSDNPFGGFSYPKEGISGSSSYASYKFSKTTILSALTPSEFQK